MNFTKTDVRSSWSPTTPTPPHSRTAPFAWSPESPTRSPLQKPPETKMRSWERGSQVEIVLFVSVSPRLPTRKLMAALQPLARFPDRVTHQPTRREPFFTSQPENRNPYGTHRRI